MTRAKHALQVITAPRTQRQPTLDEMSQALTYLTVELAKARECLTAKTAWIQDALPDMRQSQLVIQQYALMSEAIRHEVTPWIQYADGVSSTSVLAERINALLPRRH